MAATNKCLAHSNKSRAGGKATNEAEPRAKCRRQSHEGYENESYRQSDRDDADLRDRVHRIHGHPSRAHAALAIHAMGAAQFSIAAYGPARIPPGFNAPPLSDLYVHARAANQHCMARKMCDAALRLWGIL
jgi:hypothetical protein